jgi:hypothetical protein
MNTTLLELFQVSGKNDFEFTYKVSEGENVLDLDLGNKKVKLTIGNPEDKNLEVMIRDAIITIKGDS